MIPVESRISNDIRSSLLKRAGISDDVVRVSAVSALSGSVATELNKLSGEIVAHSR
jgi:hypothetical protein